MRQALNSIEPDLYPSKPNSTTAKSKSVVARRAYSFEIHRPSQKQHAATESTGDTASPNQEIDSGKAPTLPLFNSLRSRVAEPQANPISEPKLTSECVAVATCEAQLRRIVAQIEDLYLSGPIVDGWLESRLQVPEPAVTTSSQDTGKQPVGQEEVNTPASEPVLPELPHTSYYLCGVDAAGKEWSYSCPGEQLPSIIMAIARHRKLQQLLERMYGWETHLKQVRSRK